MKYTVTLRDRVTGDQKEYTQPHNYSDEHIRFQWLEGKYACDCNRSLVLWDDEDKELPCNRPKDDTTRRIDLLKIVDETGRLVWPTPIEEDLAKLYKFISGETIPYLGPGIYTYPNGDENNKIIHSGCLELEKKGLIYRKKDKPEYVLWLLNSLPERR